MRTLIDINEKLLNEALKITGAATKKEVVNLSLEDLVRRNYIERLKSKIGKRRFKLNLKELKKMREDD